MISEPGTSKHQRKRSWGPTKSRKFRWHDGKGRQLTAGGLLPYDGEGIWLVGEMDRNGSIAWTDLGGRYEFEDGDIFKTIAREVGEELYHSSELLRRDILYFSKRYSPIYVNGHRKIPVYVCYPVPISELSKRGFILDPELFEERRQEVLKSNPMVPPSYYPSVELKYFSYAEIRRSLRGDPKCLTLKFRLRSILRQFLPRVEKTEKYHLDRRSGRNGYRPCWSKPGIHSQKIEGSWRDV